MDWKIGAALLVIGLLLLTAVFSNGLSLPALPSLNLGGLSGLFAAIAPNSAKSVDVDAILDIQDFSVSTKADSIEVELHNPSSMTVGDFSYDLSAYDSTKLILSGWNGKISINGTLSLDGTAESVQIEKLPFTSAKPMKLVLNDVKFKDLSVKAVSVDRLAFPAATGYIYVGGGKTTVRADGEPVDFTSFNGDMTIDTSLRISGTGRVSVSGAAVQ